MERKSGDVTVDRLLGVRASSAHRVRRTTRNPVGGLCSAADYRARLSERRSGSLPAESRRALGCTAVSGYERTITMSAEENKALIRHLIEEALNKGRLGLADEYFDPDYVVHIPSRQDMPRGPTAFKQVIGMWRAA